MSVNKKLLFQSLYFLIILLSVVFIIELSVRYIVLSKGQFLGRIDPEYLQLLREKDPPYQYSKDPYSFDKRFGWKNTPNTEGIFRGYHYPEGEFRIKVHINSLGFKSSREYEYEQDKVRIALLGDSFVQAAQVKEEDGFASLIEKNLKKNNVDARVYNFGLSSTGTAHQHQIFFYEAQKIKPDIVVLAFFANDLIDNSPYYFHERPDLVPRYLRGEGGKLQVEEFSQTREYEYVIQYPFKDPAMNQKSIRAALFRSIDFVMERIEFLYTARYARVVLRQLFGFEKIYHSPFDVYRKEYPPELTESVKITSELISNIYEDCRSKDVDFLLVFIPAKEQVHQKEWRGYLGQRRHLVRPEAFDLERPNQALKVALKKKGIPYLDLLGEIREHHKKGRLYYQQDNHLNVKGHRVASEYISEHLLKTASFHANNLN